MRLFDEILQRFLHDEHLLASERTGEPADFEMQAAVALILLEAAHGDEEYLWQEHRTISNGLKRGFGVGRREVIELLDRAEILRPPICRLGDITALIRDRFDETQREEIVRLLWRVIESDGTIFEWEEVFGEHVARAVGVSAEFVRSVRAASKAPTSSG